MRFKELLEYKRDITATNLGEQLVKAITLGAQSSVGNTINKLREIIPGIEISSDRGDESVTQIMATLGKMRQLDSKQMFEHDDEVGVLFDDLMQTLGELRYIIYDETEKEEEENQELILD